MDANDIEQEIADDSDLRKYRTELPNMADDELDPFQYRLYGHYKRVGNCHESVRTTAAKTRMSIGQVVDTRNWLSENGWITVNSQTDHPTLMVHVIDRWPENFQRYAGVHQVNKVFTPRTKRSPGEPKNQPSKNKPNKNGSGQASSEPQYTDLPKETQNAYFEAICQVVGMDVKLAPGGSVVKVAKSLFKKWRPEDIVAYHDWRILKQMGPLESMWWIESEMAKTEWRKPVAAPIAPIQGPGEKSYR